MARYGKLRITCAAALLVAGLAASAPAQAQVEEWARIDAAGRIVADLSGLPIADVAHHPGGIATAVRTDRPDPSERGASRSIIRPDGTLDPRRYSIILPLDDGIVKATGPAEEEFLDRALDSITERFRARGHRVFEYLGAGLVLAGTFGDADVFDLAGNLAFPCPDLGATILMSRFGTYSEGLCAFKDGNKWGAVDTSGKLMIPHLYDKRFRFEGGVARVLLGGEVLHVDRENVQVQDPDLARTRVVCLNPEASWKVRRFVLVNPAGEHVSKEYDRIELDAVNPGHAVVKKGDRYGLIDLVGKEIIRPGNTYSYLGHGGDGFILAEKAPDGAGPPDGAWRDKVSGRRGYLGLDGKVRIPLEYHKVTPFRDGHAYVCRLVTNPDLVGLPYPHSFYEENVTKDRFGKVTTGSGTKSFARPGEKYGYVVNGEFKDGVPHGTCRKFVPLVGYHEGEFRDGKPHGRGAFVSYAEGRRYQGEFVDGLLQGQGFTRRPDGSVEFVGVFKDGRPWEGAVYLPGNEEEVLAWKDGKNAGLQPRGRYRVERPPEPERGPDTVPCPVCFGTGTVALSSRKAAVVELRVDGWDWMGGPLYHLHDTGFITYVDMGTGPCGLCRSSGRVVR